MLVKKQKISQVIGLSLLSFLGIMPLNSWAQTSSPDVISMQNNSACIDPFEKMNRTIYKFNRALDRGLIRSIAYGYYSYTPKELQIGVHNFFENLSQPITIANDILQCKIGYAAHDTSRFVINSTFGIFGFFEVASFFGLEPRKEDFGQTMEAWGYKRSIYLMLPIFGPSTLRDTIGFVVDSLYFDPIAYMRPIALQYGLSAGRRLDQRVALLPGEKLLENIGVDEYLFIRNFYFQKRALAFKDDGFQVDMMQSGAQGQGEIDTQDPFAEPGFDTDTSATVEKPTVASTESAVSTANSSITLAQADTKSEDYNLKTPKVPEFRAGSRVFKAQDPKAVSGHRVEGTKVEPITVEAPKVDASKVDADKLDPATQLKAPRLEDAPEAKAQKVEAPKVEAPKIDAPKIDAPKADVPPKIETHRPGPEGSLNSHTPEDLSLLAESSATPDQTSTVLDPPKADPKFDAPKITRPFFIKEIVESTS